MRLLCYSKRCVTHPTSSTGFEYFSCLNSLPNLATAPVRSPVVLVLIPLVRSSFSVDFGLNSRRIPHTLLHFNREPQFQRVCEWQVVNCTYLVLFSCVIQGCRMGKGLSKRHRIQHAQKANEGNLRKAVRHLHLLHTPPGDPILPGGWGHLHAAYSTWGAPIVLPGAIRR